jgi:hypothetical protein
VSDIPPQRDGSDEELCNSLALWTTSEPGEISIPLMLLRLGLVRRVNEMATRSLFTGPRAIRGRLSLPTWAHRRLKLICVISARKPPASSAISLPPLRGWLPDTRVGP